MKLENIKIGQTVNYIQSVETEEDGEIVFIDRTGKGLVKKLEPDDSYGQVVLVEAEHGKHIWLSESELKDTSVAYNDIKDELIVDLQKLGFRYNYNDMNFDETYLSQLGINKRDIIDILSKNEIQVTEEILDELKLSTISNLINFLEEYSC